MNSSRSLLFVALNLTDWGANSAWMECFLVYAYLLIYFPPKCPPIILIFISSPPSLVPITNDDFFPCFSLSSIKLLLSSFVVEDGFLESRSFFMSLSRIVSGVYWFLFFSPESLELDFTWPFGLVVGFMKCKLFLGFSKIFWLDVESLPIDPTEFAILYLSLLILAYF